MVYNPPTPDTSRRHDNPLASDGLLSGGTLPRRAVYMISVAAELTGLHPQTLRIYERKGLLQPARTVGGSRLYSDADLARLRRIAELTEQGINLAGVLRVFELEHQIAELQAQIRTTHLMGTMNEYQNPEP